LIEVDAASRTKVEDTRDLLDNVQYAPSRGRYKVYLIDEVHMLSASSFNALLKTLEEPPPHVKFLFATTDPQKLPVTILSRCLQFNLRRLSVERISTYCQSLLDKETIPYEAGACKLIGIAADGSMRDGLSLLDQAIAYGAGSIKVDDVTAMLGSFDNTQLLSLVEKLISQDARGVIQVLAKLCEQVPDLNGVLKGVLSVLHGIALFQQVPDACDTMFEEQGISLEAITEFASQLSAEEVQLYYQIGLTGQRDLDLAPSIRSGLEMILLRMLAFRPSTSAAVVPVARNTATLPPTKQSPTDRSSAAVVQPASNNMNINESMPERYNQTDVKANNPQQNKAPVNTSPENKTVEIKSPVTIHSAWHEIAAGLDIGGIDKQVANQCVLVQVTDNNIELALAPASAPLHNKEREARIQQSVKKLLGLDIFLTIHMKEVEGETPSAREQRIGHEKIASAEAIIDDDENVKSLLEAFDGYVQPDSVQPVE